MNTILIFLGSMPGLVVSGIVGALFGLVAGLLAMGFSKIGWKNASTYLVAVAVAASVPLSQKVVIPAAQHAVLNQGLPRQLDESTIFHAARQNDDGYTFSYELIGDIPADFDVDAIKQQNLADICGAFADTFRSKADAKIDYEYQWNGGSDAFRLVKDDCA